jgi:predicted nucleotidyltransferase
LNAVTATIPDRESIRRVVHQYLPSSEYRAFLFGSRARGTAAANSDWDIGILGPEELPGHTLQRIHAGLDELPTLHRFDVVDLRSVSDSFRRHAMDHSVPL